MLNKQNNIVKICWHRQKAENLYQKQHIASSRRDTSHTASFRIFKLFSFPIFIIFYLFCLLFYFINRKIRWTILICSIYLTGWLNDYIWYWVSNSFGFLSPPMFWDGISHLNDINRILGLCLNVVIWDDNIGFLYIRVVPFFRFF